MKTIKIKADDIVIDFVVPPERQGQLIEVSFASVITEREDCMILRRVRDRSDQTEKIEAYHYAIDGEFEPQSKTPRLGRRIGRVVIEEET
jgi:hypothetical protein